MPNIARLTTIIGHRLENTTESHAQYFLGSNRCIRPPPGTEDSILFLQDTLFIRLCVVTDQAHLACNLLRHKSHPTGPYTLGGILDQRRNIAQTQHKPVTVPRKSCHTASAQQKHPALCSNKLSPLGTSTDHNRNVFIPTNHHCPIPSTVHSGIIDTTLAQRKKPHSHDLAYSARPGRPGPICSTSDFKRRLDNQTTILCTCYHACKYNRSAANVSTHFIPRLTFFSPAPTKNTKANGQELNHTP